MALSQELIAFVKDGLQRGLARSDLEAVLLRAGWPPEQVRRALGGFADVEFAIPVPQPIPAVSAREAFMYVLMFATLYLSAYNVGELLFSVIDQRLPDPASDLSGEYALESIRWSLSSLVVAFPIFLGVTSLIARMVRRDPTKRASTIRWRLTYVTLFIAACVLIGDVITIIHSFLAGELTMRFVLKVVTVAAISGTVFGYYLPDLRLEEKEPET